MMMNKNFIKIGIICGTILISQMSQALTLRIGHNASIEDPRTWAAETFGEKIKELSNGKIKTKIFPSGQLGDTKQMLEGLKIGTIDIHLDDPGVLAAYGKSAFLPWVPFLYRDQEHFFDVWSSPLGDEILKNIETETGYKQFGMLYRGARNISSIKPIHNMEELKGLKIRVPNSPIMIDGFQSLGASPTPMAFTEVFGALQRKVIDAQENPVDLIVSSSLYQVSSNIIMTQHVFGSFYFQMWADRFDQLKDEEKQAILKAAQYTSKLYNERITSIEQKALTTLKNTPNVQVIEINSDEREKMTTNVNTIIEDQYQNLLPWVQKIKAM